MGLVGVIHSTNAIEAIQRFIGRIDLGMIPSILDTVIYIEDGNIADVLELRMTVKVPSGMEERDLARPVIEVRDFETHKLRYDIFVFGEQVSVIPVNGVSSANKFSPLPAAEKKKIHSAIGRYINTRQIKIFKTGNKSIRVEVPDDEIPKLIGHKGKTVTDLEKRLGLRIDVKALGATTITSEDKLHEDQLPVDIRFTKTHVVLSFAETTRGTNIEVHSHKKMLFTGSIGKKGEIKIERSTSIANEIIRAINQGETIFAIIK
jgi:ATPase